MALAVCWRLASGDLGARFSLDLTLLVIVIMTGRILPMFTRNATGIASIRSTPVLDKASIVLVLLVAVGNLTSVPGWLGAVVAAAAGGAVLLRTLHWGSAGTASQPLLWVLHLGHLWVGIGLLLKAASALGANWSATWLHALTVGGIGLLTLGMMVRVTLGHTGRMLASPRSATAAFIAVSLAALVRVVGPLAIPSQSLLMLTVAGSLWSLAFVLFLISCGPMLLNPRVDGRPG